MLHSHHRMNSVLKLKREMALGSVPSTKSIQQQSLRFIRVRRCLPTRKTLGPSPKGQSSLWLIQILKTLKSTQRFFTSTKQKARPQNTPQHLYRRCFSLSKKVRNRACQATENCKSTFLKTPPSILSTKLVIMTGKVTNSVREAGATTVLHLSQELCA